MTRYVGNRKPQHYETSSAEKTWLDAPVITERQGRLLGSLGIDPKEISGLVVDIGSGSDDLTIELLEANRPVVVHRVNPVSVLGDVISTERIEAYMAVRERMYLRAALRGVDPEAVKVMPIYGELFPTVATQLPQADWVFSIDCFPTSWQEKSSCYEPDFTEGLEALNILRGARTAIVLATIRENATEQAFYDQLARSPLSDMAQKRTKKFGGHVLVLTPNG